MDMGRLDGGAARLAVDQYRLTFVRLARDQHGGRP